MLWLKEKKNAAVWNSRWRKKCREKVINSFFIRTARYLLKCHISNYVLKYVFKWPKLSLKQAFYTSNLLSKLWNSFSLSWKPSAKAPPDEWDDKIPITLISSLWHNTMKCFFLHFIHLPVSGMPCARCIRELSTSLAETKKIRFGAWSRSTTFSSSTRKFTQRSVCCFLTWRKNNG